MAQRYYELLTDIKEGRASVKISEETKAALPDFPKFAITYSVTEDEEGSDVNQEKMLRSLRDYNGMFGTHFGKGQIQSYNKNLNKRLARKEGKYKSRDQQLDIVIVVDRLLTGFDAPCLSTLFIDRQPFGPHDLIQAFSRTNRLFDNGKMYGQIVTFQSPNHFKKAVDNALKLYSMGGTGDALVQEWDVVEKNFIQNLAALRYVAAQPGVIPGMSLKEKASFASRFQKFDRSFAQLQSFTRYNENDLEGYGITRQEYEEYIAHYLNVIEELRSSGDDSNANGEGGDDRPDKNYELVSYIQTKVDYEYIVSLLQDIVNYSDDEDEESENERNKKLEEAREYVDTLCKDNAKLGELMARLITDIENNREAYRNQHISAILEDMRRKAVEAVVREFAAKWYVNEGTVMYAADHYRDGNLPNINRIKEDADYSSYKESVEKPMNKLAYRKALTQELKKMIENEIIPLRVR